MLSEVRHAFVSEGDFQFELMKAVSSKYPDAIVTAEYCYPYECDDKAGNHTDIIVELHNKVYPIELKYKIIGFDIAKEDFDKRKANLPSSKAYNSNCHAFFFDVYKTQRMVKYCSECEVGFCLFLTNDPFYWNPSEKQKNNLQCREFLLDEGKRDPKEYFYYDELGQEVDEDRAKAEKSYAPRECNSFCGHSLLASWKKGNNL